MRQAYHKTGHDARCRKMLRSNPLLHQHPIRHSMRILSAARFFPAAVLLAISCGPQPASAQPAATAPRPVAVPARPAAPSVRPAAPSAGPATAPSPRAASCHNGMAFDRFLADLKQQAVAGGASQPALAAAAA